MRILFTTDPHIGFRPKSHVTTKSAQLYQETIFHRAMHLEDHAMISGIDKRVMLGDLFHNYSNPEHIVQQGAELISRYDIVMSGNHDVRNRYDTVSSLELIQRVTGERKILFTHDDEEGLHWVPFGSLQFCFLCHYYIQAEFEAAVRKACDSVNGKSVLCLHCNVGDGHGETVTGDQSSLYLTEELQDLVTKHFDLVLVGHEHNHRIVRCNGRRIVILGNHFPVSFGEMKPKYAWSLDTEDPDLGLQRHELWLPQLHYVPLAVENFDTHSFDARVQFVEITGTIKSEERPAFNQKLLKLWKDNPRLLAVRNNVEVINSDGSKPKIDRSMDFVSRLQSEVEAAGFAAEYQEVSHEL